MRRKDQPAPPCAHMKKMLHDAADGHSRGLRLWFTLQHVVHCGPCRRYLECLKEMISALRGQARNEISMEAEARLMSLVVAGGQKGTQDGDSSHSNEGPV